ncbi:MAG: hypothetical protein NXH71_03530 [Erythrobacteraceae bacterium]|nr:hypothetical protein [Erythrobacteraceae bacterium]
MRFVYLWAVPLAFGLASCGSDEVAPVSLSGAVSGNSGPVVLILNGVKTTTVPAGGGNFQFGDLDSGSTYSLALSAPPAGQECTITNASGVLNGSIGDIAITCIDQVTGQRFFSSAAAGEVVDFDFDFDSLTYSWETTKSSYGALDLDESIYAGSGRLIADTDRGYGFLMEGSAGNPFGRLTINADGRSMVARVAFPIFNGVNRAFASDTSLSFGNDPYLQNLVTVPVLGVTDKIDAAPDMVGVYNFVSSSCKPNEGVAASKGFPAQTKAGVIWNTALNTPDEAMCTTSFGTIELAQNGADLAVTYCERANLGVSPATCSGGTRSGTASLDADTGAWAMTFAGDEARHALIQFPASNSQNVGWLDTDGGFLGFGTIALSEQQVLASDDVQGDYRLETNLFNGDDLSLCSIGGNIVPVSQAGPQGTFLPNSPWTGMGTIQEAGNGEILGMLAGSGMLISRNPITDDPWTFEIGQRIGPVTRCSG